MENTIPRNVTDYLLRRSKEEVKIWSLKTSIGNINAVFNAFFNSPDHNLYKLKIELNIFQDGDAYFLNRDDEKRKKELERILKNLIKPVVKKLYFYITESRILIYITNDTNKTKRNDELFSVIKKIIEFIFKEDVVRSMDINLRNKHKAFIIK